MESTAGHLASESWRRERIPPSTQSSQLDEAVRTFAVEYLAQSL